MYLHFVPIQGREECQVGGCIAKQNINMTNYGEKIIKYDCDIQSFLTKLQNTKSKVFFVIDSSEKFIGTVTEGDLRRHLIKNGTVPEHVDAIVNRNSQHILEREINKQITSPMVSELKGEVPIIDKLGKIVGIYPDDYTEESSINLGRTVTAIAPTRVSFAGGGSDLNYWFDHSPGCVVNLAINKYARVTVRRNFSSVFNIFSVNTGESITLDVDELKCYERQELILPVCCLKKLNIEDGVDIKIYCDFPPGTGLGGSSSLVTAIITALSDLFNFRYNRKKLIKYCYDIERNLAGIPGGWQDQIAAAYGGLCITYFKKGDFGTHKIDLNNRYIDFLNSSLFLVPLGGTRKSASIHEKQRKVASTCEYEDKMRKIVQLSKRCADLIGQEKLENFGSILHEGWLLKRSLGEFISSPQIDAMYLKLQSFGAEGGRLLGAGKTGFLLMYVLPELQPKFISMCSHANIECQRINIDLQGARTV